MTGSRQFIPQILACLFLSFGLVGCRLFIEDDGEGGWQFKGHQEAPPTPRPPGFYGVRLQWNDTTGGSDVNGEVGHPLHVSGPRADVVGTASWSANHQIISGSLPPGLKFEAVGGGIGIEGIPTERGHWIVKLKLLNIESAGKSYPDSAFEQELRFHITGSGKVND